MNSSFAEAKHFMRELKDHAFSSSVRVLLAPPFPLLSPMVAWSEGLPLEIGVQNIHSELQGAFTGEVSASLVREMGASFAIIGHSERRKFFHEDASWIGKKVKTALSCHLQPILCVGETAEERKNGHTHAVLQKHLEEGCKQLLQAEVEQIMIAYEPVWAIGTGMHATKEIVEEVHRFCRLFLTSAFGAKSAEKVPILYGGSVTGENISSFINEEHVDGVLVGGASLSAKSFLHILHNAI